MRYLLLTLLYLISLFPLPVIYLLSDTFYFFAYHVFSYRKVVILRNLEQAFPEKSEKEIRELMRQFYKSYSDVFLETIKLLSISENRLRKMIHVVENNNWEKLRSEKLGAFILTGHRGNFEMAGQFLSLTLPLPFYGAYKPFKSKIFEYIWFKLRHNFKMKYIPVKQVSRFILQHASQGLYTAFLNDQNPTMGDKHCWVNFLNKETIFFTGPVTLASKLSIPVYFMDMVRVKRGKYQIIVEVVSETPYDRAEHEIVEKYVHLLEQAIRRNPSGWLWSHRRWKHHRKPNSG
ncbi:lysophospholipid acyltransferase family protein [Bacteroidota bacterium]